ncbi:ArsR family transcriptional regulator [Polyangium aurulentum]|uniref:ArsR family transcriptional regulator n=1 Tax=Polyangium aurulentum TaxID=2567896 RepID=UPI0010ADAFB2|nr:ArsR family transcriptional regulator [Polyangium aurulentum]UQA60525.1 helix-turn-helix domain-containing protein [Polyangium aurulentum]
MNDMQPPPPAVMMEMILGRFLAQAIGSAARFGFADHLASGPRTVDELAAATGTLPSTVHRLLRMLAGSGIFVEVEPRRFANTPLSETLRSDVPGSMRGFARFFTSDAHTSAWFGLDYSMRTGKSAFDHIHGRSIWQFFQENPELGADFSESMSGLTLQTASAVAETYDFSGIGTLVDVGGSKGALLTTILERHLDLRGVVFDLPEIIAGAREHVEKSPAAARCKLVGGDFFKEVPDGDAFILKHVIHDWSDEDAISILQSVAKKAKPGAKCLLVEFLVKPGNDFDMAKRGDLEMLIVTNGGRERTQAEFADLFEKAGFSFTQTIALTGDTYLIEAIRA